MGPHRPVLPENSRSDRLIPVLMMETAENWPRDDATAVGKIRGQPLMPPRSLTAQDPWTEARMGTSSIVVGHPLGHDVS